jgi:hypothetical protein
VQIYLLHPGEVLVDLGRVKLSNKVEFLLFKGRPDER